MNRSSCPATVIVIALTWLTVGCASSRSKAASQLPSTEIQWPSMELTLAWNGARYLAPEPVVVPPRKLAEGLKQWDRRPTVPLRVALGDGRSALVFITCHSDSSPVLMSPVWVYRSDGSLELEQHNDQRGPNAPIHWTVYEPDGRTPHARVSTVLTRDRSRWYIEAVVGYRDGMPSWRYFCSEQGIVQSEERFNNWVQWEERFNIMDQPPS
jgi:hypothetical protein